MGTHRRFREFATTRPMTTFFTVVFGLAAPILIIPVLADHGVLRGGSLPMPLFALGVTVLVMFPMSVCITAVTEGPEGVRDYFGRVARWRFGVGWWALVLWGMPVMTLLVGRVMGGVVQLGSVTTVVADRLIPLGTAFVVINLWEEAVWAGFVQRRLERRHNLALAAALTAVPFAAIHLPLLLVGDVTAPGLLIDIAALVAFAVVLRLCIALLRRASAGSVLAAGLFHSVFNETINPGGLGDRLLTGANLNYAAFLALLLLTVGLGAATWRRSRPSACSDEAADGTRSLVSSLPSCPPCRKP